ncbi:MAG: flavin-containing monooxygenase, partial [Nevskiales bacterium]
DNTYPGAACDVQSHLYSYSFEPKHDWTRKFGLQTEIRSYMESCAVKYGVRHHIQFNQEVTNAEFDKKAGVWAIRTKNGDTIRANILITALGQLNRPAFPRIKGREDFRGKAFHSARWDHDFDLNGKRVAVIGTGASAIQFVPQIVPKVKQLYLFQRSAAWVVSKPDRPFTGFEQWLFDSFPVWDRIYRAFIYWKNESRAIAFTRFAWLLGVYSLLAHWHRWRQVSDKHKRRLLKPDYPVGCKRVLISNDYYPALDQKHVEIVSENVDHIEADAVVTADGKRWPVDAIIHGTGFQTTDFLAPMVIRGLNGRDLNQAWRDGAEAYKGISVAGFPNLFMMYGPNTNLAHSSIIFMLESQARYIMQCTRLLLDPGLHYMDVRADRQAAYNVEVQNRLKGGVWDTGCTSWYKTASGKITNNWPGFTFSFRLMTSKLDLADYELYPTPSQAG